MLCDTGTSWVRRDKTMFYEIGAAASDELASSWGKQRRGEMLSRRRTATARKGS